MSGLKNPIGIYFAYWERNWDADFLRYVEKARRLGFDVLEIAAAGVVRMCPRAFEKLRKTAAEAGIELTLCIGLPAAYDVSSPDAGIRRAGIAYVRELIAASERLGAKLLGGILYGSWPAAPVTWEEKLRARDRSLSSLKELSRSAEDAGVTMCLEVVNRFEQYLLNTAAEGVSFVREIGSEHVKLLLDSFHMNIEEDGFRAAIETAGPLLGHFHIGENNRKPPGSGRMPWAEILGALKRSGYAGRIVMEPFTKPGGEVGRDIRIFRDVSEGADASEMDRRAAGACRFVRELMEGLQ